MSHIEEFVNSKISVSAGNTKMGAIPSVSLPPVITCRPDAPCKKECYACKLCRLRPSVRNAYQRNLDILSTDPNSYWTQVKVVVMTARYFRFHVSGDIPNMEYFGKMVETAKDCSGTEILAFTKQYEIVNSWISANGELPRNLHIIFSGWGQNWTFENPYHLPVSQVIFRGSEPDQCWKICGGNCTECACQSVGCWELKNGETIAFYQH